MSIRSAIIEKTATGYRGIYCHSDGYLTYVGKMLLEHYMDPAKVSALIDLGFISELNEEIGVKHDSDWRQRAYKATRNVAYEKWKAVVDSMPESKMVDAYIRDHGEKGCSAVKGATLKAVADRIGDDGYVYVFEDGKWTCNGDDLETAVTEALLQEAAST